MAAGEKSVVWVIAMLMLFIAVLGWAFAAAQYAHGVESWRANPVENSGATRPLRRIAIYQMTASSLGDFVGNAFKQIPNLAAVASYNFRERLWLPLTVLTLEVLLVVVGFKMHALDRELSSVPRTKKRKIALPRD